MNRLSRGRMRPGRRVKMKTVLSTVEKKLSLKKLSGSDNDRECTGVYAGDLLSWVMSHAMPDDIWVTIMSNSNVIAVASLADVACVILAEGVTLDEKDTALAAEKGINVYSSEMSTYEICAALSSLE